MSKLYTNKTAGTSVLTGKIKSISEDRKSLEVTYQEYDYKSKQSSEKQKTVKCMAPINDTYKVGQTITAVGYVTGPVAFQTECISNSENVFEMSDLAFISGHVSSVKLNEEKDQNGNPKLTREGNPKKRHFDIHVPVLDETGNSVDHIVKVYDLPSKYQEAGQPTQIEKMQKRFADFVKADETPMYVTIATTPGNAFSFQKDDGSVYLGASHLGIRSLDIMYEFSKQKSQSQETNKAPEQPQPSTTPEPVQQPQEINGFEADVDLEEEFAN